MVSNKDRYKVGSWCAKCQLLDPEPSYFIRDLGVAIAPNPDVDRHPEIKIGKVWYDEKGWKYTILARLKIIHLNRGKRVFCKDCGRQTRAVPLKKTKSKNNYEPSLEGPKRGRRPGPDIYKEQIDEWVERITANEVTLEDVEPRHLESRVKKRLDKQNEGKESSRVT